MLFSRTTYICEVSKEQMNLNSDRGKCQYLINNLFLHLPHLLSFPTRSGMLFLQDQDLACYGPQAKPNLLPGFV